MCGIAGLWREAGPTSEELSFSASIMADAIQHRGPDDFGTWSDATNGVALGFRRLAIVDLSPNGHQPMQSQSGRYWLVFNGEVYNYLELANELRAVGRSFRGHSDTEVILAAFDQWGIEASVRRFVGMFAMAVWDTERRSLFLIRDRLGIKPLFIYKRHGFVAFSSELKGLAALPEFTREIDIEALAAYFRYLYVPAPLSIYRNVTKLLPGHILEIRSPMDDLPESRPYWSLEAVARQGRADVMDGSDSELVEALESILTDAIRIRLRADVPLGAFLSGGIDSSAVVAIMQEISPQPVRTFTIGFDVREHDESSHASAVARFLGTDHQEIRFRGEDALALVPTLAEIFDEPLANPSALPTYLLCRATRDSVVVALSGDGGDELFAGYNRYLHGRQVIERAGRWPRASRRLVAAGLTAIGPAVWDRIHSRTAALLHLERHRLAGEKIHKLGNVLRASTPAEMYGTLVSAWQQPPVAGIRGVDRRAAAVLDDVSLPLLDRMMLADQLGYLVDDLLAKVDRTSMAASLEVRVPILDHRIVELSWRMPERAKLRPGTTKWVLRQVLERRVPRHLIDRPKTGFTVPLADWLRGPLRGWAEERLDPARLAETAVLDVGRIRQAWKRFVAGKSNDQLSIWAVLMFEEWRERWMAPAFEGGAPSISGTKLGDS
jgi:asparagine synthase (glutamine-hydrolysing)